MSATIVDIEKFAKISGVGENKKVWVSQPTLSLSS